MFTLLESDTQQQRAFPPDFFLSVANFYLDSFPHTKVVIIVVISFFHPKPWLSVLVGYFWQFLGDFINNFHPLILQTSEIQINAFQQRLTGNFCSAEVLFKVILLQYMLRLSTSGSVPYLACRRPQPAPLSVSA